MFSFHKPSLIRSRIKYLFATTNSPAKVRRLYKLLVNGSKHSLNPRICDVLAVGIGANNVEFLSPFCLIEVFNFTQSYLLDGSTPHKSNCNIPSDAGEPSKDEYAPRKLGSLFLFSY